MGKSVTLVLGVTVFADVSATLKPKGTIGKKRVMVFSLRIFVIINCYKFIFHVSHTNLHNNKDDMPNLGLLRV